MQRSIRSAAETLSLSLSAIVPVADTGNKLRDATDAGTRDGTGERQAVYMSAAGEEQAERRRGKSLKNEV